MINRMVRVLTGLLLSMMIIHLVRRLPFWDSRGIYNVDAWVESFALGICVALLTMSVGSIAHLRIRRFLDLTRIEESIDPASELPWEFAQSQPSVQAHSKSPQPTFQPRIFVNVDVLPAFEMHEENVR